MAHPSDGNVDRVAAPSVGAAPIKTRLVVTDGSKFFTIVATLSWVALVAAPLLVSMLLDSPMNGAPLVGVVLWLLLLRLARWLSPLTQADRLMHRGSYIDALAMCDQSLAVTGTGAWVGQRRLAWLNRRVTALLGLGRYDEALAAALDAMEASPDPETIANLAVILLRLNRYEAAVAVAREASMLTNQRSVRANATLAWAMLARGHPAEAEALARMSLVDIEALAPYVRRENHVASLSALCRAQRVQGMRRQASATLARLRRAVKGAPTLTAVALLEEAGLRADEPAQAAEQTIYAYASDPVYTRWYLTQPGTLPFLRETPDVAPLFVHGANSIAEMNAHTPDDEVIARLLRTIRPEARPRPASQRSRAALTTQLITLGVTLALLMIWMWRFFISQSL